jgi:3-phenylpropionate/cinnamic acid dioxygenase small subunit
MVSQLSDTGPLLRHDDPDYIDVLMFLIEESELLDARDYKAWMGLLASNIDYTIPITVSRARSEEDSPQNGIYYHLKADRAAMELRVKRLLEAPSAWSENPPPRTRRFVSNVRVRRSSNGEFSTSSYELLLCSRHDLTDYELLSAERRDVLGRNGSGGLELRRREIQIDQTRLGVASLPVPF